MKLFNDKTDWNVRKSSTNTEELILCDDKGQTNMQDLRNFLPYSLTFFFNKKKKKNKEKTEVESGKFMCVLKL